MESMVLFTEISGVQPKLPSVQVCNTTKCAPQVCNVVDMVCTHLANQNLGRAIRKILHFSSLAFKLLPVCQCDHFCCITALFLSLPRLCKYSSNNGAVGVLSGTKSCGGARTVVFSRGEKRDSCPLYIKTGIRTQRPKATETLPYLKPYH